VRTPALLARRAKATHERHYLQVTVALLARQVNSDVNHQRRKPRSVATLMTVAKEARSVISFEPSDS